MDATDRATIDQAMTDQALDRLEHQAWKMHHDTFTTGVLAMMRTPDPTRRPGPDLGEIRAHYLPPRVGCSCEPDADTGELYTADGWACPHDGDD